MIPLTDYKAAISPVAAICTLPGLLMFSQSYRNPFDAIRANQDLRIFVGFLTILVAHLALILLLGHFIHVIDVAQQVRNLLIISMLIYLAPTAARGYVAAIIVQFALLSWILGSREPIPKWSVLFMPNESAMGWELLIFISLCLVGKMSLQVTQYRLGR